MHQIFNIHPDLSTENHKQIPREYCHGTSINIVATTKQQSHQINRFLRDISTLRRWINNIKRIILHFTSHLPYYMTPSCICMQISIPMLREGVVNESKTQRTLKYFFSIDMIKFFFCSCQIDFNLILKIIKRPNVRRISGTNRKLNQRLCK